MKMLPPDQIFKELFVDLHNSGIWPDGKMISDAIPKKSPEEILKAYRTQIANEDFDLKSFFEQHFDPSITHSTDFKSDVTKTPEEHIEVLWDVLKRDADKPVDGSSFLALPNPYIVPGGRFNEIYYWDSYFTMLGLQVSGKVDLMENMIDNFTWLLKEVGFIPNGNRSYFLGRSQPPFYALMVSLLAEEKGEQIYVKYLPMLEKEYAFWMKNSLIDNADSNGADEHVVQLKNGMVLNRYFDRFPQPRQEMYAADLETQEASGRGDDLFLDLRAACESGWDFSQRWFLNPMDLNTIQTSKILPVDLNCLLFNLEKTIAQAYELKGDKDKAHSWKHKALNRKTAIQHVFWNTDTGFYHDYNFETDEQTPVLSLAGVFPLFFGLAEQEQAMRCAKMIEQEFLCPGGVVSSTVNSGQQWDAPNGWAPLQWVTIQGLRNYGFTDLSDEIKKNWVDLNVQVYKRTGKMLEKYNVQDVTLLSGGGEYPVQDGFGWTNGVLLRLLSE
ncbi:alpha,alpha-trehalase TreF [Caldithrix abyssi]|nr:alpha,alpha-trehalase TreF [Caldithrix abyssi]